MKKVVLSYILAFSVCISFAQVSSSLSYQGILTDQNGNPNANIMVQMKASVAADDQGQTVVYEEVHDLMTNDRGTFNLELGNGIPSLGQFTDIEWLNYHPYINISYDLGDGNGFKSLGWTKFNSVPFCFSSKYILCPDGLRGERGSKGPNGRQGTDGQDGRDGIDGLDGTPGRNGLPILTVLDTVPTVNINRRVVMDSGANRADGNPGLRYYTGSEWIDL